MQHRHACCCSRSGMSDMKVSGPSPLRYVLCVCACLGSCKVDLGPPRFQLLCCAGSAPKAASDGGCTDVLRRNGLAGMFLQILFRVALQICCVGCSQQGLFLQILFRPALQICCVGCSQQGLAGLTVSALRLYFGRGIHCHGMMMTVITSLAAALFLGVHGTD